MKKNFVVGLAVILATLQASAVQCPPPSDHGFLGTRGVGDNQSEPGDASVAVGSHFGIAMSNWQLVRFDVDGQLEPPVNYVDLINAGNLESYGDAVVRYDSDSTRFFVLVRAFDFGLLISKDSDPELTISDWWEYQWDVEDAGFHYHNMEISDDYIFFTALWSGHPN